jgi:hypothetical protein
VWDDESSREPAEELPGRAGTKAITVVVVSIMAIATLCLCCLGLRQALSLIDLGGPWLF